MLKSPRPKRNVGAFWGKKDKNGKGFLSGTVDLGIFGEIQVNIFKNSFRDASKNEPEYYMKAAFSGKEKE